MPKYDYKCAACNKVFEVEQKITDDSLDKCILCGSGPVEKLITGGNFVLKGTGWYKTDYASSSRCSCCSAQKAEVAKCESSGTTDNGTCCSDSTNKESTKCPVAANSAL